MSAKHYYLLLLLLIPSFIWAQTGKIEGTVVDKNRNSLKNYHVIVLNPTDSSFISGESFGDTCFMIESPLANCLIRISRVGYKEMILPVKMGTTGIKDLGVIVLPEMTYKLNEVTVKAKAPVMIMHHDKLIYNVENTTISNAGNAIDLLKRTPYIVAGASDEITVAGRGKTLILVDGKRIRSDDELRLLNSSRIKQVEVIENPGAKFEAEGHAVVNIILRKSQGEGLQGSIYSSYLQGKRGSFFISPELAYQAPKMRISGTVGLSESRRAWDEKTWMKYEKENYLFRSYSHNFDVLTKATNLTYSAAIDYKLTKEHMIGLFGDGYSNQVKKNTATDLEINKNDLPQSIQRSDQQRKETPDRNSAGLNYLYKNQKGYEVSFITDMTFYRIESDARIKDKNLKSEYNSEMANNSDSDYDLYSAKLDVMFPLSKRAGNLEFGGKYSRVQSDNNNLFKRLDAGQWVDDSLFTNNVEYTEQILGAYLQWGTSTKNWRFTAGIRLENTWTKNLSEGNMAGEYKNDDLQFFPSLFINYSKSKNYSYRIGYTRRISRPNYSSLNNTLLYIDSLSTREGNPSLKSTIYNTLSLNTLLIRKINIGLSYSYIESPQDMLFINDPVNIESYTIIFENVKDSWSVALNIAGNFKYRFWTAQPFFSFSYSPVKIVDDGVVYTFKNPMYSLNWVNQFDLGKNWNLDADILFEQPAYSFKKFGKKLNLNIGCTKKLLQNRMVLSASVRNEYLPFTQEYEYSYKYGKVEYDGNSRYSLMLSVRYYLRDSKFSVKKKKHSNEEELKRL